MTRAAATSGVLEGGFVAAVGVVATVGWGSADWMSRLPSVRRMLSAVCSVRPCSWTKCWMPASWYFMADGISASSMKMGRMCLSDSEARASSLVTFLERKALALAKRMKTLLLSMALTIS